MRPALAHSDAGPDHWLLLQRAVLHRLLHCMLLPWLQRRWLWLLLRRLLLLAVPRTQLDVMRTHLPVMNRGV
jgi:hypothetical protein